MVLRYTGGIIDLEEPTSLKEVVEIKKKKRKTVKTRTDKIKRAASITRITTSIETISTLIMTITLRSMLVLTSRPTLITMDTSPEVAKTGTTKVSVDKITRKAMASRSIDAKIKTSVVVMIRLASPSTSTKKKSKMPLLKIRRSTSRTLCLIR